MLWVLPPFIALALAVILAISARVSSAAAAQQASALATLPLIVIAYGVVERHAVPRRGRCVRHRWPRLVRRDLRACGVRRRPCRANASSAWAPATSPSGVAGVATRTSNAET